jgi:hypothetical protein
MAAARVSMKDATIASFLPSTTNLLSSQHPLLCSSWSSSSSSRSDISLPTSSPYLSFLQPRRRRRQRCFFSIPFKTPIPQRSKQVQPLDPVHRTKSKREKKRRRRRTRTRKEGEDNLETPTRTHFQKSLKVSTPS